MKYMLSGARGLRHTYRNWRYAILFYSLLLTLRRGAAAQGAGIPCQFPRVVPRPQPARGRGPDREQEDTAGPAVLPGCRIAWGAVVRPGSTWRCSRSLSLAIWTVVALLTAASALRFALGAPGGGPRAPLRRAQCLPARRDFLWCLLLDPRADLVRLVCRSRRGGSRANFSLAAAIYYSFVTLTTLGYGDIVPRSEVARGLAS